jgi:hypothetical protein
MSQNRRNRPQKGRVPEGERSEQDVTEQRVEVQGEEPSADGPGATGRRENTLAGWLASTAVRTVLAVVGVVVVLYALGQLVGVDLLELVAEALGSEIGRWVLIGVFGLLLIGLAQRGFRR